MCSFYDDCFFSYHVCSLYVYMLIHSVVSTCVLKKSFEYHIVFVVVVVVSRIDETLLKTIIMIFIALVYLTQYVT